MTEYQGLASKLAQTASQHLGTSFVSCYLTGSTARGEERPGLSDIDILIVTRGKKVIHQWDRPRPQSLSFLKGFAKEAERLARDAMAPRPPLRLGFLITTIVGQESLRKEADGMLYFDLLKAKLLAGKDVREGLRPPSWRTLNAELLENIGRWRDRMIVNLSTLNLRKEPYRLASYAIMYSLPTAGAFIALKRKRLVMSKKDIPAAFKNEFPTFDSASVLQDALDEYLNWKTRDQDLGRLSSLWLRTFKFLLEVEHSLEDDGKKST